MGGKSMNTGRWVIPLDEVPTHLTVSQYIFAKTDLAEWAKRVTPQCPGSHLALPLKLDLEILKNNLSELLKKYPAYSYPYGAAKSTPLYRMIYLTYNPKSENPQINSPLPFEKKDFPPIEVTGITTGKNSYNDTLSIFEKTNFCHEPALARLLEPIQRTIVRSRLAIHSGKMGGDKAQSQLSWHTDEKIFINTRINIPVISSSNFAIEYLHHDEHGGRLETFDLLEGFAYSFDTGKPHRFFAKENSEEERVSLILGISPWFDFCPEQRAWISNEFYGKMHPLDMIYRGFVGDFFSASFAEEKISDFGKDELHSYHSVT